MRLCKKRSACGSIAWRRCIRSLKILEQRRSGGSMVGRSLCLCVLAAAALSACASLEGPDYEIEALMRSEQGQVQPGRGLGSLPGTAGAVDTTAGRNRVYRETPRPDEFTDEEYRRTFPRAPRGQ
jgi:hypothetical protein